MRDPTWATRVSLTLVTPLRKSTWLDSRRPNVTVLPLTPCSAGRPGGHAMLNVSRHADRKARPSDPWHHKPRRGGAYTVSSVKGRDPLKPTHCFLLSEHTTLMPASDQMCGLPLRSKRANLSLQCWRKTWRGLHKELRLAWTCISLSNLDWETSKCSFFLFCLYILLLC